MIYPQNFEQKIGFDSIRHLLKEKCLSTLGQERVDEMNFSESFKDINEWLEQVMEFMRIIQEEDSFPDQYFFDVRPSLKRIRVEGMYLDEQELFDLRRSLETIRDIIHFLTLTPNDEEQEKENSPYPALQKLAGSLLCGAGRSTWRIGKVRTESSAGQGRFSGLDLPDQSAGRGGNRFSGRNTGGGGS